VFTKAEGLDTISMPLLLCEGSGEAEILAFMKALYSVIEKKQEQDNKFTVKVVRVTTIDKTELSAIVEGYNIAKDKSKQAQRQSRARSHFPDRKNVPAHERDEYGFNESYKKKYPNEMRDSYYGDS
jgi:hypothetical protein